MARSSVAIAVEHGPTGPSVRLEGEVDMASAPGLRKVLNDLLAGTGPRRVVLDLRGITFFGSPGLAALISARNRLDRVGGELVVVLTPGSVVDRVISIAGLRQVLTVVDDGPAG